MGFLRVPGLRRNQFGKGWPCVDGKVYEGNCILFVPSCGEIHLRDNDKYLLRQQFFCNIVHIELEQQSTVLIE